MKIILTGATGFTGSRTLPLLREIAQVRCLVRTEQQAASLRTAGIEAVLGDLSDSVGFEQACAGCDALVNIASLGFGHGPGIVAAAERAGIKRAVFVSTTAIFTRLNAPSKARRVAAEEAIGASSLRWTILRPTMIYGSGRDRNICRLIKFLRFSPVLPVFGPGTALMQPIFVDDLASGIVGALGQPQCERQSYNLSGAAPLSYNELVRTVAQNMGRRVRLWHVNATAASRLLSGLERCRIPFPVKAEQVARLQEDKAFSWSEAARDFGFNPRSFEAGVRLELADLKLLKK
jgi:uncharacterized protein YbjT (DUF2867 family)